jgi:hypothetical protein
MTKFTASLKFASAAGACIAGAALGWSWLGPLAVIAWVIAWSFRISDPLRQIGFTALVGLLGTGFESGLMRAGIYLPRDVLPDASVCPLWVMAIWVSLGLIAPAFAPPEWRGYVPLAVGGALLAPLFYLAADSIPGAAIHLQRPLWPTLVLLALLWQGLWPGIVWLSQSRWYRVRPGN